MSVTCGCCTPDHKARGPRRSDGGGKMSRSLRVKGGLALPYCGEECERNLIPTRHLLSVEMIYPSLGWGRRGCGGPALSSLRVVGSGAATPPTPTLHTVIVTPARLFGRGSLEFVDVFTCDWSESRAETVASVRMDLKRREGLGPNMSLRDICQMPIFYKATQIR